MAKFCRYCGNQIQEGGVCNCQGNASNIVNNANQANANQTSANQANLGGQVNYNNQANFNNQANYANQANYVNQNNNVNRAEVLHRQFNTQSRGIINNFSDYFKDMKSTVIKAINEKNTVFMFSSAALLVISIIVNFLIMFNKFANDINSFVSSYTKILFRSDIKEIMKYRIETDNFEIILYGFLFSIAVIAVLLASVFIISRINKSNWSNEGIVYATIINTIPLSFVFLLGGILQFVFSYKFLILIHILYLVTYGITLTLTYNMVTEGFKTLIDVLIFTILMFIGILVVSYIYTTIFSKVIGTFKIDGQTIRYYVSLIRKSIAEEMGDMKGNLIESILEEFYDEILY